MNDNECRESCCFAEKLDSEICAKEVSVFGGCLTFEQQQDVNSSGLSMCAETCYFPGSVKLHTLCSFQSEHCFCAARDLTQGD